MASGRGISRTAYGKLAGLFGEENGVTGVDVGTASRVGCWLLVDSGSLPEKYSAENLGYCSLSCAKGHLTTDHQILWFRNQSTAPDIFNNRQVVLGPGRMVLCQQSDADNLRRFSVRNNTCCPVPLPPPILFTELRVEACRCKCCTFATILPSSRT